MREAILYDKIGGNQVKCKLCNHRCLIAEGKRGICGVRENKKGVLYSLVYGKLVAMASDPIEKKPLFHFLPGSTSFSIATVGCNFRCLHCQNWDISQRPKYDNIVGDYVDPEKVVEMALDEGCKSISYTYVEPTVFMEYALDVSKIAKKRGLKNVFVTNGYMTAEALDVIGPYLDSANVDIKAFTEDFYGRICGSKLQPVLDSIKRMIEGGVWVEITTLVIPTLNDGEEELRTLARYIVNEFGDRVPWHISAFYPMYKLTDLPPTPPNTLRMARDIGFKEGLKYVYEGNIPGEGEETHCPKCGEIVLEREGYAIIRNKIKNGKCTYCGTGIEGVFEAKL